MVFACQFEYNDVLSDAWDLMLCRFGSASQDSNDTGLKLTSVTDELINFNIDYGAKNDGVLELEMQVTHITDKNIEFTREEIREISNWLLTPDNHWLKFYEENDEDYFYYGRFVGVAIEKINGMSLALTLRFQCTTSYAYSKVRHLCFTSNDSPFRIGYYGDEIEGYTYPNVEIKALGGGVIRIENDNEETYSEFKNLKVNETIKIDHNHVLMSDNGIEGNFGTKIIGDDFNRHWIRLYKGDNYFYITGDCEIKISYKEAQRVGEF